jgi:alpha-1,6-mannosyltransferase
VVHVPFGVEREHFSPTARSDEERSKWLAGAPASAKLLVGIGRFAVEKRWDVVLDAFLRLRERQEAVLVLFGDGPERAQLEARVAGRADVHFVGFLSGRAELARALASADLLVHGCPFETFGLGVAEAMATGLPAVVPDQGGAAELVDASCGEHYPSGDPAACAAAVERALGRDQAALRAGALRAVAQRVPTIEGHFRQVFALYEDLLARRRANA